MTQIMRFHHDRTANWKRKLLGGFGAMALGVASLGAQAGTLSIGHTTWVGYGTLYLAQAKGFFEENGLTVELPTFEDSSAYMAAQAAGHLDGSAGTIAELLKYRSADFCFKSVVVLDGSNGGDGLLADESVASVEEIKGETVAMNEGGASQFWLAYLLSQHGMSLDDVTVQNMSADAAAAAFIAGRVPVAVTWEPNLSFVRSHDAGQVLVDSSATPGVIIDVVALSCDVIDERPDDVRALVQGLYKAVDYLDAHPAESYQLMADGVGGYLSDPADLAEATEGVEFYGQRGNRNLLGTQDEPGSIAELIDLARDTWNQLENRDITAAYKEVVDPSFAETR
ncbi:ABC transporter substrate-binding protein [Salinicola avicenniae]|uniref:ABC transporter substrate-binding protein n=1 Tax=Salinicola avicenniae TaxID=2916836 RepID=UPI002072E5B0|nr:MULTISPECIES: ABC transporter substrate-binding protein [unclassified Salinicola]